MAPGPIYAFGPFRLDEEEKILRRDGQPVPLTPRAVEMLLALVKQSGQLVPKEDLLKQVWPDTFVEEGNLTVHMSALRKALGDAAESGAYIETVPRRGYRFCMPVEVLLEEPRVMVLERHKETHIVREEIEESMPLSLSLRRPLGIAVMAVLVLGAAGLGWRLAHRASASAPAMRVVPFATYTGGVHMPAFAPDGERIAFPWTGPDGKNWDIYAKVIGNDPPLRLTTDPGDDGIPAWSPDGRHVAFLRENRAKSEAAIYTVGALGGPERKLLTLPFARYFDLEWTPDGQSLVLAIRTDPRQDYNSHRFMAIFLLSVDTLETRQLTFPKDPERDQRFAVSPDGKTLAFLRHDGESSGIWLVPLAGGDARRIFWERTWIGHLAWTAAGGSLVFTSDLEGGSKLFRIAANGGTPELLPLSEDHAYYPAVARNGNRMAFVRMDSDADLWQVSLRRPGQAAPAPFRATARFESSPQFSPDGRWLAFTNEGSGKREVWFSRADGTEAIPLTDFQPAPAFSPSWSPDGRELVFAAYRGPRDSRGGVFVLNVQSREVRRLSDDAFTVPWWSRDGQWIYLCLNPLRGKAGIWKVPALGGAAVLVSESDGLLAQEAADGKTLYFARASGGIWKKPLGGEAESEVIPGFAPARRGFWRVAEGGIYYVEGGDQREYALVFLDFANKRSHRLAALPGAITEFGGGLTVSPGGASIVYSQAARETSEIVLVENFR